MANTALTPIMGRVALDAIRSTLPFDLSCRHTVPGEVAGARCQLWAGHDGNHAVMFSRNGTRIVRSWNADDPRSVHDGADCRSQPWVRGFPQAAWHEGAPPARRGRAW